MPHTSPRDRGGSPVRRLGVASAASALLAAAFIAVGWTPGTIPGIDPGPAGTTWQDVVGLVLLGVAVVLGALAVALGVRRR